MLGKFRKFALNTLFPIRCLACQKPDVWLCKDCLQKIPLILEQKCPICENKITPQGQICFDCRKKLRIDGLLAAASYSQEVLAQAVHLYKYRFIEDLKNPLGKIMAKALHQFEIPLPDIIIPIPLHPRRLRWRGFNQSELLARYISCHITPGLLIPVENNILVRKKYTTPQMEIKNYFHRRKNLENAFAVSRAERGKLKNKRVWLVDDVATTGSTLFESARVLKKSGAGEVWGIVIARQELKKV